MKLQRTKLIGLMLAWGAVTALILTTACARTRPNPDAPAATAPASPTQQQAGSPGPSHGPQTSSNPQLSGVPEDRNPPSTSTNDAPALLDPGTSSSQIFSASAASAGGQAILGVQVDPAVVQALLGAPSRTPLFYTSGGEDSLYATLQTHLAAEPADQQAVDRAFAGRLSDGSFVVDSNVHNMTVTVKIQSGTDGSVQNKTFPSTTLDSARHFEVGNLTEGDHLLIDGDCMDEDAHSCSMIYLTVQDGSASPTKKANMIIRQTRASVGVEGFVTAGTYPFYDRIVGFFQRAGSSTQAGSMTHLLFRTSETIGGSTAYELNMTMQIDESNAEIWRWTRLAVKPEGSTAFSVPVHLAAVHAVVDGQERPGDYTSPTRSAIQAINLVNNDGRGNFMFQVNVAENTTGAEPQQFSLIVRRIHPHTRELQAR